MGKKGVLILVFLIVFLFGNFVEAKKISEDVLEAIQNSRDIRVAVKFKNSSDVGFFESLFSGGRIPRGLKDNVKHDFGDVASFFVSESELNKLKNNPYVEHVEIENSRNIFLDDSTSIVNATRTWATQISGVNLTGEGETACIIDSGVYYQHSDFGNCFGENNLSSNCKIWGGYDYCADNVDCSSEDSIPEDLNGHGTHVAGIIAADGGVVGVAPDSRIIMIKVSNSSGTMWDSELKSALTWCINNATNFNISVISMSLGAGLYSSYCDGVNDPYDLTSSINEAVGKNISVVVATGNDGSSSKISSPACIENSTAVGASTKSDEIWSSSNRNSLTDLFAPGSSITSTYNGGGYASASGTSMATPHVAAAFLLANQFKRLENNEELIVSDLENDFNSTGKIIEDSNLNFSRINIYETILFLDETSPEANLISPLNGGSLASGNSQVFSCNSSDELQLSSLTFKIWNSTSLYFENTTSATSNFLLIENNLTLENGDYEWNCFGEDEQTNSAFASSNFTFSVSSVNVVLDFPSNNTKINSNLSFVCNSSSNDELTNATFKIWNHTSLVYNFTKNISGFSNNTSFDYNFSLEGNYSWNCFATNNIGYESSAFYNFSILYDLAAPVLYLNYPLNNSWSNGNFNLGLNEEGSCDYSFNYGAFNYSMSSIDNLSFFDSNTTLVQDSSYNLTYYCNDSAGNVNSSEILFYFDFIKPNVSLISPLDGASYTGTTSVLFEYNVSDNLNLSSCDLILNDFVVLSNSSEINNLTNNFFYSVSAGSYNWNVNCTDGAGNVGNSSFSFSLTVNSASNNQDGGGGGGGSISEGIKFIISNEQIQEGIRKKVSSGDEIEFDLKNETHVLNSTKIENNSLYFEIHSEPKKIKINLFETKKVELDGDNFFDLEVTLFFIEGDSFELFLKEINEEIPKRELFDNETIVENEESDIEEVFNFSYFMVFPILFLFVCGVAYYFWKKKKTEIE